MIHLINGVSDLEIEEKLCIALNRILISPLSDDSNKKKILDIIDELLGLKVNKNFRELVENTYKEESPIYHKEIRNMKYTFSDISNLSIPIRKCNKIESNIAFVNPFIDIVESIFIGLAIHYPVILEGPSGRGMHTAIEYVSKVTGYDIIFFGISNVTTFEDLLGKTIPKRQNGKLEFVFTPSKILNLINSESKDDNTIIVIENLNQASSSFLDSIAPIFDQSQSSFLLSNGDIIQKGNYHIIGFYDPSSQTTSENKLPESFKNNCIYHVIPQYTIDQTNKIALKIFNEEKCTEDQKSFMNYYHTMSKFVPKSKIAQLYTLNDIKKYKLFTEGVLKNLDSSLVENMLLLYKYSDKEDIEDAIKLLDIDVTDLWPRFSIENGRFCANLYLNSTKIYIDIILNNYKLSQEAFQYINSLTMLQRNCLLFLMCAVISKQPAIIEGPTASGKTHNVMYFAQLVGRELIVIQANNETGIQALTGQLIPSNSLSSEDIEEIIQCFNILCKENDLREEIYKILDINDVNDWEPNKFKKIEDIIRSSVHKNKYLNEANLLKSKRSFLRYYKQEDSAFIKAMQKGDWVLIDGIESAQKELFERIVSLCQENPVLNLYERGPEYVYSRNAEGEFKIHEDFQLFITYNPEEIEPDHRLSQSNLNKFCVFVSQPIDMTTITSGIVLHGSMNKKINEDINILLSSRLKQVHEYAKKYSLKNQKQFAASNKFTGRSLLCNMNILNTDFENDSCDCIANILHKCISLNYCNSCKEPEKFYSQLMEELFKEPSLNLIQAMKKDVDLSNEKYKNILKDLYELQMLKETSQFKLKNFYEKIYQFEYGDIDKLIFHIVDTLHQMDSPELINRFGSLSILLQFLCNLYETSKTNGIKSTEFSLKIDDIFFKKKLRTTHNMSQMSFIKNLIEKDLLIDYTPVCFYSNSSLNTISEIAIHLHDINFKKVLSILSKILQTPSIFQDAFTLLNCKIIRQSNFLNVLKLLPLFIQLKENQIRFSINHQEILVTFVKCDY